MSLPQILRKLSAVSADKQKLPAKITVNGFGNPIDPEILLTPKLSSCTLIRGCCELNGRLIYAFFQNQIMVMENKNNDDL